MNNPNETRTEHIVHPTYGLWCEDIVQQAVGIGDFRIKINMNIQERKRMVCYHSNMGQNIEMPMNWTF